MEDWTGPERSEEEWTKQERRQVTIGLYKVFRRKGKVHPQAEGNDSFKYLIFDKSCHYTPLV